MLRNRSLGNLLLRARLSETVAANELRGADIDAVAETNQNIRSESPPFP